jgi:Tfp pilus assembly protein PilN
MTTRFRGRDRWVFGRRMFEVTGLVVTGIAVANCGCGSASAVAELEQEIAALRSDNAELKARIAKSDSDHLKAARVHLEMVTSDQDAIDKFAKSAKKISETTGVPEDLILRTLADGWRQELWDRERDALKADRGTEKRNPSVRFDGER